MTINFSEPPPLTGAWKDTHMMRGKKQQVRFLSVGYIKNMPLTIFLFLGSCSSRVLEKWVNCETLNADKKKHKKQEQHLYQREKKKKGKK